MVSHQMMIRILKKMPAEPISLASLARKTGIYRQNLYRVLRVMAELGLVDRVEMAEGRVLWVKKRL